MATATMTKKTAKQPDPVAQAPATPPAGWRVPNDGGLVLEHQRAEILLRDETAGRRTAAACRTAEDEVQKAFYDALRQLPIVAKVRNLREQMAKAQGEQEAAAAELQKVNDRLKEALAEGDVPEATRLKAGQAQASQAL